jgi:hypothetical protein
MPMLSDAPSLADAPAAIGQIVGKCEQSRG